MQVDRLPLASTNCGCNGSPSNSHATRVMETSATEWLGPSSIPSSLTPSSELTNRSTEPASNLPDAMQKLQQEASQSRQMLSELNQLRQYVYQTASRANDQMSGTAYNASLMKSAINEISAFPSYVMGHYTDANGELPVAIQSALAGVSNLKSFALGMMQGLLPKQAQTTSAVLDSLVEGDSGIKPDYGFSDNTTIEAHLPAWQQSVNYQAAQNQMERAQQRLRLDWQALLTKLQRDPAHRSFYIAELERLSEQMATISTLTGVSA